ncbi:MAG: hypothetical protein M3P12_04085 [Gemmatimonadota bacterium]|nr:hypothetical protein [Gemmatimonadota bacterium]
MRSITSRVRLALLLPALSCVDPTALVSRPSVPPDFGQHQQQNSYSINAADRTVYLTLVQVRGETGEPIRAFVQRMFKTADSVNARRLVIDLRSVTGGDARLLAPLIRGVVTRERFVQVGGLYVVVGPRSFSPGQNAATLLQQYANPIFTQ